jgi:cytochrome c oxidase subunit III
MPTTVNSSRTVAKPFGGPGLPGPNGNGSKGNGWHGRKDDDARRRFLPEAYRVATWVVLGGIVMIFAALSSIYIALSGDSEWRPVRMPSMFFLSTGIILGSSATMETARRSLKHGINQRYVRFLFSTLLLGFAFLAAQLWGWRQLVAEGAYFSGRPHSSFFYLFTGAHGVHLLGGIVGLTYLVARTRRQWDDAERKLVMTDVISLYWHFMDGLWIWLFLLLLLWR